MRLKIATTFFLCLGLAMAIAWPWILGKTPPKTAPIRTKQVYLARSGIYFIAILGTFTITSFLALMIIRRQREEFVEERHSMVESLIEETMNDHRKS